MEDNISEFCVQTNLMIIKIAIGLIASILVLANYKALRKKLVLIMAFVFTLALLATGIYLITNFKGDKTYFSATFSPFLALFLLVITRFIYKSRNGKEIIIYMRGLYPIQHEDRFVTDREKRITFLITLMAAVLPVILFEILFRT